MTTLKIILVIIFFGAVGALIRWKIVADNDPPEWTAGNVIPPKSTDEASTNETPDPRVDTDSAESYLPEPAGHETIDDLSDSGAVSIRAEIARCVTAELWPEAIKWALHATHSLPDHDDFQVTLAEIYAKSEDRAKFVPLFAKLYIDLDGNPIEQSRLLQIAAAFVPDDPLVRASLRDAGVDG
jgi:hypothetical protein